MVSAVIIHWLHANAQHLDWQSRCDPKHFLFYAVISKYLRLMNQNIVNLLITSYNQQQTLLLVACNASVFIKLLSQPAPASPHRSYNILSSSWQYLTFVLPNRFWRVWHVKPLLTYPLSAVHLFSAARQFITHNLAVFIQFSIPSNLCAVILFVFAPLSSNNRACCMPHNVWLSWFLLD